MEQSIAGWLLNLALFAPPIAVVLGIVLLAMPRIGHVVPAPHAAAGLR